MNHLDAYQGINVLVTGDTGFKGSWLALWLTRLGATVFGAALPPETSPSHFQMLRYGERMSHRDVDIRDLAAVQASFDESRPAVVFHLAAKALVRASYRAPKETFDVNVGGTVNVLECVRSTSSVKAVVIVTSDKCYENREWVHAYRESDAMGGHDPYSASKGAAELVTQAYRRSFFGAHEMRVGVASVRAGNVIGGGDWAEDRIVPDCVRALAAQRPILVRNPHAVRPWQHVLEPLGAYLLVGAKLLEDPARYSDAFNVGPHGHDHVTVGEVARRLVSAWGSGTIEVPPVEGHVPHEAQLLRLACEKATDQLGWRPVLSADEAIAWSADWYRAWLDARGGEMTAVSLAQIERYEALMRVSGQQGRAES